MLLRRIETRSFTRRRERTSDGLRASSLDTPAGERSDMRRNICLTLTLAIGVATVLVLEAV